MQNAIYYKILQRRNNYRNPKSVTQIPMDLVYTESEYKEAYHYIQSLELSGIKFTHPEHKFYPQAFLKMREPPLFLEYLGEPLWMSSDFISIVGSREIDMLTEKWMRQHITEFLTENTTKQGVVSGGARGVDQLAHTIAIKCNKPTIFVLPSGLCELYPSQLKSFHQQINLYPICFLSEFEMTQTIRKAHFYFRNRLIAALGDMTLVTQATLKSGSLLTVHHCLENGRPVLVVPAHPEMHGFDGNIRLLRDGAYLINNSDDLLDFWKAESSSNLSFVEGV